MLAHDSRANHFGWIHSLLPTASLRLISSAVCLPADVLGRVGVWVRVRAALGGSSPLLDNILKLALHGGDVIVPFDSFLCNCSLVELDLCGIALSMSNLDASLLRGRASQLLDEAS